MTMRSRFSDAARQASLEVRRARAGTLAMEFGLPAVFVVRLDTDLFGWEIRQYGGVMLAQSTGGFLSTELARQAGETALALQTARLRSDLVRPGHGAASVDLPLGGGK